MAREIVRNADILDGRWHFAGTNVAVAAVRRDHHLGAAEVKDTYRFMQLSDEEIANALAFDFPEIREAGLDVQYASLIMRCVCGEDTPHTGTAEEEVQVPCQCGRTWLVTVTFKLLSQQALAATG